MENRLIQKQVIESQLMSKEEWLEQNKEALKEYNDWIEKNGIFSDMSRKF